MFTKIKDCFWCGGKGYVIKNIRCGFCKGTGEYSKRELKLRNKMQALKPKITIIK